MGFLIQMQRYKCETDEMTEKSRLRGEKGSSRGKNISGI